MEAVAAATGEAIICIKKIETLLSFPVILGDPAINVYHNS